MPNLGVNGEFRNDVISLVEHLAQHFPQPVGLVMRWNQNDNLRWTYSSLPNGQVQVPGGGAAHAEEAMVCTWQNLVQGNNGPPQIVEIFLSQSPCLDRSPQRNCGGTTWPKGCGSKLRHLITQVDNVNIDWRIAYFRDYQEDQRIEAQVSGGLAQFNGLDNVDIYKFSDRHRGL